MNNTQNSLLSLTTNLAVLINGNEAKLYHKDGKTYVEGKIGSKYSLKVRNNTSNRILAILSVDGLEIISASKASMSSPGYIINANDSLTCRGFRISDDEVAEFQFSKKEKSYAASKGTDYANDVGVIGLLSISEKVKLINNDYWNMPAEEPIPCWNYPKYPKHPIPSWPIYRKKFHEPEYTCKSDSMMRGMNSSDVAPHYEKSIGSRRLSNDTVCCSASTIADDSFSLGTEMGNKVESKVITTDFERGELITQIEIYYMTRENLIKNGIIEANKPKVSFPKAFQGEKYCQPPIGWKGFS